MDPRGNVESRSHMFIFDNMSLDRRLQACGFRIFVSPTHIILGIALRARTDGADGSAPPLDVQGCSSGTSCSPHCGRMTPRLSRPTFAKSAYRAPRCSL